MVPALSANASSGRVIDATGEHSVWPNTIVKGAPNCCSKRVTRAAGTKDPPEHSALTLDKSRCVKLGCSVMAMSMVGTPTIALPR